MGLSGTLGPKDRRWKRFKVDIRAKLRRVDEPEGANSVVRTYELSEGGMSLYVTEPLAVGDGVLVEFILPPETTPLRLRAVVRNRRGFRFGLEFSEAALHERFAIGRYLGQVANAAESSAAG